MSNALEPIKTTGEAFVAAIKNASPLTAAEHLDMLDEIVTYLVEAHCAHDKIWQDYYYTRNNGIPLNK